MGSLMHLCSLKADWVVPECPELRQPVFVAYGILSSRRLGEGQNFGDWRI